MSSLKNLLKRLPLIGDLILSIYRTIKPYKDGSAYWLKRYVGNKSLTIVQIGSNDGISGDPIYDLAQKNQRCTVLLVEPVPYIFEKLKQNYGNSPRFKFENAAINETGKSQTFYSVSKSAFDEIPDLDEGYNQIGSFYKDNIIKLSEGKLTNYIEEMEINCLSLEQLFAKNEITTLDVFHIDAEGYDWKILSQLDLNKYQPQIILFENLNLEPTEKQASIDFLKDDYYIFAFRIDFLCVRKTEIKKGDLNVLRNRIVA